MTPERENEIKKLVITEAIGAVKTRVEVGLDMIEGLTRHIGLYHNDVYKALTVEIGVTGLVASEPYKGELVFTLSLVNVQNTIRRVIERMPEFQHYSIRFSRVH